MTVVPDVAGPNVVPGAYRGVAVSDVPCPLDEESLTAHFLGREAYRRTRFIVAHHEGATALLAVEKATEEPLFTPITGVRLLAGPDDCAYLVRPEVDTAVPSALGRAAVRYAPGKRAVVIRGTYEHVSFILDPQPLQVTVREVVPPHPAKLVDQVQRLLDVSEDLPPMVLVPDVVDLTDLATSHPSGAYLLPCRGGGAQVPGATADYLDERPEKRDWVLVGCERSQQIHTAFYGERATQVDICPRKRPGGGDGPLLTKCCLLESDIAVEGGRVVVPWGSSLTQIKAALTALAARWEPTWAPA